MGSSDRLLGPYVVLRKDPGFRLLALSHALSTTTTWMALTSLLVLAYHLGASATTISALNLAHLAPYAVLLPWAGGLADRTNRARLLGLANVARGLCLVGLATITTSGGLPIAGCLVLLEAGGLGMVRPAVLSLVAVTVPERRLVAANSVVGQIDMASLGAGPALCGLLLLAGPPRLVFLAGAGMLLVAALAGSRVGGNVLTGHPRPQDGTEGMAEGFRFLLGKNRHGLAGIAVALSGLTLAGGAYFPLSLALVEHAYHLGDGGMGTVNVAYTIGGLLGGGVVGGIVRRGGAVRLFALAAALSSIALVGFGWGTIGVIACLTLAVVGLSDVVSKALAATLVQASTPLRLLGRVFGAFESLLVAASLLGAVVVGPVITGMGAPRACVTVALVALGLLIVSLPLVMRLEGELGVRLFLRHVPALDVVPFALLDTLAARFALQTYQEGTDIIRQGEQGDTFYIVKSGSVEVVSVTSQGQEVSLGALARTDYFGEIALLQNVPRTATVRARTRTQVYALNRDDFQALLQQSERLGASLQQETEARNTARTSKLLLRF